MDRAAHSESGQYGEKVPCRSPNLSSAELWKETGKGTVQTIAHNLVSQTYLITHATFLGKSD